MQIRLSSLTCGVLGDRMSSSPRLWLEVGIGLACVFLCHPAHGLCQAPAGTVAGKGAEREGDIFFEKEVLPILKTSCFRCHADGKTRGGLSLASRAGLLKGGDLGPVVSLDRPEESLLLSAIRYQGDLQMPPKGKLAPQEIDVLTRWVKAGVPWTETAAAPAPLPASQGMTITEQDRAYWAYRPIERPQVPPVKNGSWPRQPIDAFILAPLEAKGLSPAPPADRLALVRRVHYDLIGLPPTPDEVDAFVRDPAPDAYERLVDRLLESPHYGEKWARHWLDIVRYAETDGFEFDRAKPFIWRYRDYVIAAFNNDKPYDRFIREQIGGDQLDEVTPEALIATGYYGLGQWDSGAADRLLQRYDVLDGIVSTTGQAFLGMSLGCARCHDHKKDPIPQRDYYRLLAYFHNIADIGGKGGLKRVSVPGKPPATIDVRCVSERDQGPTHFLIRGNPRAKGEEVQPGFPEVLPRSPPANAAKKSGAKESRLELANWLADAKNPLTARVLVNRLWQHHFGRGIVPTPNDFGRLGEPPTHPELLDWLAAEFMHPTQAHGQGAAAPWSIKRMHRLIMSSSAYRMSAKAHEQALRIDPANTLFWRFTMRRLTAEEVRDSILAVSGRLNLKMAGPSVLPPLPREVLASQARPGEGWRPSSPEESCRRSIYVHVKRSLLVPQLVLFDFADTDASCPVRFTTTVPTQALAMLNGEFSNEQAALFAARLRKDAPQSVEAQVRRAIRLTTGRLGSTDEVARDVALIRDLRETHGLDEEQALRHYCLVMLNTNEFFYVD
jgi:hypothetical protein